MKATIVSFSSRLQNGRYIRRRCSLLPRKAEKKVEKELCMMYLPNVEFQKHMANSLDISVYTTS